MPSIIQAGNAASTGPVITGATDGIQEQQALIESLTTRLTALESNPLPYLLTTGS